MTPAPRRASSAHARLDAWFPSQALATVRGAIHGTVDQERAGEGVRQRASDDADTSGPLSSRAESLMVTSYASIFRSGLFDSQVVVVTGGGSGIGRCTAHELASLGAKIALI